MLSYPYIWEWCYKRTNKQAKKLPFVTSSCGYHPDCANSFQKKSLQMIVKCPARELTETRKRDHISYRLDSAQSDRAFFFLSLTFWKCLLLGSYSVKHNEIHVLCELTSFEWNWTKLNSNHYFLPTQSIFSSPGSSLHSSVQCFGRMNAEQIQKGL